VRSSERQVPFISARLLKNFLADASDRERTLKRGGGQNFCLFMKNRSKRRNRFSTITETQALKIDSSIAAGRRRWLPLDWNGSRQITESEAKEKLFNELRIFVRGAPAATGLR